MATCPRCNQDYTEERNFCRHCGAFLPLVIELYEANAQKDQYDLAELDRVLRELLKEETSASDWKENFNENEVELLLSMLNQLGNKYTDLREYSLAEEWLLKAYEIQPSSQETRNSLSTLFLRRGDDFLKDGKVEEAEPMFLRAQEYCSEDAMKIKRLDLSMKRGELALSKWEYQQACFAFKNALSLDPKNLDAQAKLEKAKELLSHQRKRVKTVLIITILIVLAVIVFLYLYSHYTTGRIVLRMQPSDVTGTLFVDDDSKGKVWNMKRYTLAKGRHEMEMAFDGDYFYNKWHEEVDVKAALTETVTVIVGKEGDGSGHFKSPTRYSKAIELLEYLKRTQKQSKGFDINKSGFWDVDKVISYVSTSGVSIFDANKENPINIPISQLSKDLKDKRAAAFTTFAHMGYIYSEYPSVTYKDLGQGVLISFGYVYRLTFTFEGDTLKLNKIEYLQMEAD